MQTLQKIPKSAKTITTIKDIAEVATMFETRTKKYEERVFNAGIEKGIEKGIEEGMLTDKQHVLIDQMSIKFGDSGRYEKIIKAVKNPVKLDSALRGILSAKTSEEVLKRLK
jgi:hypothetical protein